MIFIVTIKIGDICHFHLGGLFLQRICIDCIMTLETLACLCPNNIT